MSRRPYLLRAVLAASGLLSAGLLAAAPAMADGTAPPWAPGGVSQDQNAVGGLTFYDASGNVITGGPTASAPFAAFVQGRNQTRAVTWTDTKAALFAYLPQEGQTPDLWTSNELMGLASTYPNGSAPGSLATSPLPLYTGANDDTTLATVESDFPNNSATAGYAHVYELRLHTNAPGHTLSTQYDYADISIDDTAHTWTLVFTPGAPATAPGAPTGVHATASNAAATVSWTAPANTGGAAITGYDVQKSSNGGTSWTSVSTAFHTSTATSHVVTGLANGTAYIFRVAAINSAGTGAYSTPSTAVTPTADSSSLTISTPKSTAYG
ncbi:MAG TPA: fibronectin type III domain-containing protein, partial [Jatrophihabitans sp.]|nr:fibronectin type III domain-containing protein [Jatrophihabitans sp.]